MTDFGWSLAFSARTRRRSLPSTIFHSKSRSLAPPPTSSSTTYIIFQAAWGIQKLPVPTWPFHRPDRTTEIDRPTDIPHLSTLISLAKLRLCTWLLSLHGRMTLASRLIHSQSGQPAYAHRSSCYLSMLTLFAGGTCKSARHLLVTRTDGYAPYHGMHRCRPMANGNCAPAHHKEGDVCSRQRSARHISSERSAVLLSDLAEGCRLLTASSFPSSSPRRASSDVEFINARSRCLP
ncbi:hypothetical protein R3P38DRAFT_3170289 [Favolaschia claudopus]|uniref:Uncharacterized protein n=1 Tax=Favolaschia claudopus TaxID=2862362 RepID=A0AAW0DS02_9AGAR